MSSRYCTKRDEEMATLLSIHLKIVAVKRRQHDSVAIRCRAVITTMPASVAQMGSDHVYFLENETTVFDQKNFL